MCSIQLLSNKIFSIPISMESVKLSANVVCITKKSIVWVEIGKNKSWKIQISGHDDCRKGWAFFSGHFLFATWRNTCQKVCSPQWHLAIKNAIRTVFCIKLLSCPLRYFPRHVFAVPGISSNTMNVFGTS